jgi:hypothetical protein
VEDEKDLARYVAANRLICYFMASPKIGEDYMGNESFAMTALSSFAEREPDFLELLK